MQVDFIRLKSYTVGTFGVTYTAYPVVVLRRYSVKFLEDVWSLASPALLPHSILICLAHPPPPSLSDLQNDRSSGSVQVIGGDNLEKLKGKVVCDKYSQIHCVTFITV